MPIGSLGRENPAESERVDVTPFTVDSGESTPVETKNSKRAWDNGPCLVEPYIANGEGTAVYPVDKVNSVIPMEQTSAASIDGDRSPSSSMAEGKSTSSDPYAAAVARVNKADPLMKNTVEKLVTQTKEEKEQTVLQSIEAPDGTRWHPRGGDSRSCFMFGPRNKFRNYMQVMVMWYPWFDRVILALIGLNCIFLMLGDPLCEGHNAQLCDNGNATHPCPRCEWIPVIEGCTDKTDPDCVCLEGTPTWECLERSNENCVRSQCKLPRIDRELAADVCQKEILKEYGCSGFFCDDFKSIRREHKCTEWLERVGEQAELVFAILFTVEMVAKIVCQGFFMHKGSYLRDVWNWIDFVVVIFGWVGYIPGMTSGFTALKTVRVFRPLKTMTRIPGMRPLISAIFRSFAPLLDVLILFGFVFTLFGILALQLLRGKLRGRCVFTEGPDEGLLSENTPYYDGPELICTGGLTGGEFGGRGCESAPVWRYDGADWYTPVWASVLEAASNTSKWEIVGKLNDDGTKQLFGNTPNIGVTHFNTECRNSTNTMVDEGGTFAGSTLDKTKWRYGSPLNPNPSDYTGLIHFDDIGHACLTLFQCITMEGWTDVMYHLEDGWSRWGSRVYFILVIIVGSWFVINLALAVISDSFESAQAEEKEMKAEEAQAEQAALDAEADAKKTAQNMALAAAATDGSITKEVWSTNSNGEVSDSNHDAKVPSAVVSEHEEALAGLRDEVHIEQLRQFRSEEEADMPKVMDVVVGGGCWRFRAKVYRLVEYPWFGHFIMALIGINTIILAMEHHNQEIFEENWMYLVEETGAYVYNGTKHGADGLSLHGDTCRVEDLKITQNYRPVNSNLAYRDRFSFQPDHGCGELRDANGDPVVPSAKSKEMFYFMFIMNYVLSFAFLVEMVLKLYAYGLRRYFKSGFNTFDAIIVVSSGVEIIVGALTPGNFDYRLAGGGGVLSVFRAARLFRVFKLAKSWKSLYRLLLTLQSAIGSIVPLFLVLMIFIFIFSLLGQEFFGGTFLSECSDQDFYTGNCEENPRSNFDKFNPGPTGYGSFVSIFQVLTGENWNDILYNCMALSEPFGALYVIILVLLMVYLLLNLFIAIILSSFGGADEEEEEEEADEELAAALELEEAATPGQVGKLRRAHQSFRAAGEAISSTKPMTACMACWAKMSKYSLFIFPPDSRIRKAANYIAVHEKFDKLILVCIIISSVLMCVNNPRWEKQSSKDDIVAAFEVIDLVFVVIFTAECLIKVVAWGFLLGEDAYLTNGWNVLDFIVVVVSLLTAVAGGGGSLGSLKSLRTFRALRPLRVINRNPGMKLVVNCLLKSIPSMINVAMVCLLFYVIFAILGVTFFKGQYYACVLKAEGSSTSFPNEWDDIAVEYGVLNWKECVDNDPPGVWLRRDANFDNLIESLKALFEVSSLEGWLVVMDHGTDAIGPGLVSKPMAQPYMVVYFVLVCVICNFFILNLVIGVVIDNYNALKEKADEGSAVLNEGQKEWVKTIKKLMQMKPKKRLRRPDNIFRQWVFKFVTWKWFDIGIMVCIILNCIVMALDWYNIPQGRNDVLETINKVLTFVFIAEFVLKLFALGPKQYYSDGWNCFDCVIVAFSIAGFIFEGTDMIQVLRALRIFRLVRLVRSAKGIRRQLQILMLSWPSLFNVGGLLFLVFCIYSVLGVQFFFNVKHRMWLNSHANFEDFGTAFITLFRICTGENWNGLMNDCLSGVCKECYKEDDGTCDVQGCGSTGQSLVFFVSFYMLGSLIMINLFIAVILDNDKAARTEEHKGLPESTFEQFSEAWSIFDPDASNVMPTERLSEFVQKLEPPLGPGRCTELELKKFLAALDIRDHGGHVFFGEVSQAMAYRVAGADVPAEADETVSMMERKLAREMSKADLPTAVSTVGETYAALTLQKYLRRRVSKRRKEMEAQQNASNSRRLETGSAPGVGESQIPEQQSVASNSDNTPGPT
jgi:large-conductance mechanosensitive channel